MLKIGLIGCGAIGSEICRAVNAGLVNAELVGIYDRSTARCEKLLVSLNMKAKILQPEELISKADVVVECASQAAVREFGRLVLENGKDLMILSAGALLDSGLFEGLVLTAEKHNCRIYVPSGAIAGIDGLKSASVASVSKVVLSTTKNPEGLINTPFVIERGIELSSYKEKTLLFEGSAEEAVKAFPANVNVSATLSLAGIGANKTRVRVFVDPEAERNIHEITIEGDFGKFSCCIENIPSPSNPKTSFLASLSAIATLKKITQPVQIGT